MREAVKRGRNVKGWLRTREVVGVRWKKEIVEGKKKKWGREGCEKGKKWEKM